MPDQQIKKKKIPPKPLSDKQKKKQQQKPAPKLQPAWLFPPDAENPVLNPKKKSQQEIAKAVQDREKAVDYMQRRVHGAPDRPAPDPVLLTLIGIFLTDFGFNSTSRLFTNERHARQTLNGWENALGKVIDKKIPKLEQIFRDWHRDWLIKQGDETSSSDASSEGSGDEASEAESQAAEERKRASRKNGAGSSAGAVHQIKEALKPRKSKKTAESKKDAVSSSSEPSSGSDSDADDEGQKTASRPVIPPMEAGKEAKVRPTVGALINNLKRKAPSSSSDSGSGKAEEARPVKMKKTKGQSLVSTKAAPVRSSKSSKPKADTVRPASGSSTESSSSSSSESSDGKDVTSAPTSNPSENVHGTSKPHSDIDTSDSESENNGKANIARGAVLSRTASSDSSVTINGDSLKPSKNTSASSDSDSSATSTSSASSTNNQAKATKSKPNIRQDPTTNTIPTRSPTSNLTPKTTSATPTAPPTTQPHHPSNKYQSYTYADRAYADLSTTRGKNFTKEKNKKKRGSYRGGAIDTSSGGGASRSFKFED